MNVQRSVLCTLTAAVTGGEGGGEQVNKALHTCTSWYAYVAMCGSAIELNAMIQSSSPTIQCYPPLALFVNARVFALYNTVWAPVGSLTVPIHRALCGPVKEAGYAPTGEGLGVLRSGCADRGGPLVPAGGGCRARRVLTGQQVYRGWSHCRP